ncbi:MAG: sulfatase [Planctomycetota bacterium]
MKQIVLSPLKLSGVFAIFILMASVFQALGELPAQDLISSSVDKPASPPNIILLLSDDQGWNGLSVSMHPTAFGARSSLIETPQLEKMAARGLRFSAAYSPASVCSPTRISLQTGRSPAALGWTKAGPGVRAPQNYPMVGAVTRRTIRSEETTIAEVLKNAGYATAHWGKWHLEGGGPEEHGYDVSDGNLGNEAAAKFKDPNPVDIFGMAERGIDFMKKQKKAKKPFFMQFSFHALHSPGNALEATVEKYKKKVRGGRERQAQRAAIAEDLDTGVGRILAAIEELELTDNTYVIYMSDNGSGGGGRSSLLGGGKGSLREGGIRVPLIIQGPGITADSWCDTRVVGFDLFPTFCEWAGVPKEKWPAELEGGSLVPLLKPKRKGKTSTPASISRPREELVFHFPHYQSGDPPHSVIYLDGYKMFRFHDSGKTELYAIDKDMAETNDLAPQMKEKVEALSLKLSTYLESVGAKMPTKNLQYDPKKPSSDRTKRGSSQKKRDRL